MNPKALAIPSLIAAIVLAATVGAQGAPEAGSHPILICDFGSIIEKCQEAIDIEEAFNRERKKKEDDLRKRAEKLKAEIQEIQKNKNLSERDDKTYDELKDAIEEKGRIEAEMAYENIRGQDYLQRRMQELLRGAKQFAKEVMTERKAELVIATKIGPIQLENQQDFQDELLRRRVVAHIPEVDITAAVMKRMNDDYEKRKKQ